MRRTREKIREELEQVQRRLKLYLDKEAEVLAKRSVESYAIGSRKVQRYKLELEDIQAAIEKLRRQEKELEAELQGASLRRAVGVVPRDW